MTDLVAALDDDAVEVRASAAYALGLIWVTPPQRWRCSRPWTPPGPALPAGLAAQALLTMGIGISDALSDAMRSDRAGALTRRRLTSAGSGAFTRAVPALRDLLQSDSDLTVREASATALGIMGTALDVDVLAAHTGTDQPLPLRRTCAIALGELGDTAAVPSALAACSTTPTRDSPSWQPARSWAWGRPGGPPWASTGLTPTPTDLGVRSRLR